MGYIPWGRKESDTTEQLTHIFWIIRLFLSFPTVLFIFVKPLLSSLQYCFCSCSGVLAERHVDLSSLTRQSWEPGKPHPLHWTAKEVPPTILNNTGHPCTRTPSQIPIFLGHTPRSAITLERVQIFKSLGEHLSVFSLVFLFFFPLVFFFLRGHLGFPACVRVSHCSGK